MTYPGSAGDKGSDLVKDDAIDYIEITDDDIIILDDGPADIVGHHPPKHDSDTWKIVIADDEEEVHAMTRMVLKKFEFEGKGIELISAYSGAETKELMKGRSDICILLLDVVMEEEHSGLEVVKYIREDLKNPFVRIILRTGQPGQAPEDDVVRNYDINDYKSKTELTVQKLYTAIIASIRAYRDMKTIEKNRMGLEKIVNSSRTLFEMKSIFDFGSSVIRELTSLVERSESSSPEVAIVSVSNESWQVIAAMGSYSCDVGKDAKACFPLEMIEEFERALEMKDSYFKDDIFVGYYHSVNNQRDNLIYLKGAKDLTEMERDLIRLFSSNVSVGFDNIFLNNEILDTQKEVIITLGEIVETRSKETANHVQRVSEYSYHLLLACGYGEEEAQLLRLASPMHDIGKVGIPDSILNKPGKLTPEEFDIIKTHTTIGHEVLRMSKRKIMKTAAMIALEHHERWDGTGYPRGLAGEDIHIYARITSIADVYDALGQKRSYKEAWSEENIHSLLREESGRMFDPSLIELFFGIIGKILEIKDKYPNE